MAKLIDITGKAISGEWGNDDNAGTGTPVLRTTNFTNDGVVNYNNVVTRDIQKKDLSQKYLQPGDIIIEKSGGSDKQPVGRVVYYDGETNRYLFNNFTGVLRVRNQTVWYPRYVFYALYGNYAKGGTRRYENKTTGLHNLKIDQYVQDFVIQEQTLEYQQLVISRLDKVSELIALRKEQLAKLDQLVKSRFIELFGECDERKRLEEFAALITKGASPKWQGVDYCEEGTLFVTSENVREGYLDLSKRKYLDNKINEIQPRSMLKRNDILINIVGASIGRAAVYDCDEVANINQAVALVRVDYSQINQTYLMTFLNSPQAIEMYGKMKKGGARDNLSLQNIADLQIPVASIELQKQFATFVEQTDKSKLAIQQSLDKLELLKKSLMQEYFG